MNALELKTGKQYWRRIGVLWGMFGVFGFIISALAKTTGPGILGLLLMIAPAYLLWRRRQSWVARIDDAGVWLRSGKHFAWADFDKVLDIRAVRGAARWHNHYELVFRTGRGSVFDRMLANSGEVVAVVGAIERGDNPFTVSRGQATVSA